MVTCFGLGDVDHSLILFAFQQSQTMQMMYEIIAQEIKSTKPDANPLDYLNFYCLGQREYVPWIQSDEDKVISK